MSDDAKIFIDEGWKAQVQREKEAADKLAQVPEEELESPEEDDAETDGEAGMPEANFDALVASIVTQAMLALGLIAERGQKQVLIDLDSAKFSIDMLMMLRDKTKGNLEPKEEGMLTQSISEMQQVYLARVQQYQEHALQQAGIDPNNLKVQ